MSLRFPFALPRVHTGVHLSNGRMGALVWGTDQLFVTLAHAGFWDRRGGRALAAPMTYRELRAMLGEGRELEVRAAFEPRGGDPYQIGGGRLEIETASAPVEAILDPATGRLVVRLASGGEVGFTMGRGEDVLLIEGDVSLGAVRPSWEWTEAALRARGVGAPERWSDALGAGFVQGLPADDGLTLAVERDDRGLRVGSGLGVGDPSAFRARIRSYDADAVRAESERVHAAFHARVPDATTLTDDPVVAEAARYALFKLGGLTAPDGVPATLQGPWMEEHRLPLWSNDYHFNINLQMIYEPCLQLGLHDHLRPLWRMVHGWFPRLRASGEAFFGREGAMMLPHAVDDQGHPIGSFWQGTVDHASTAWTAQMAWRDAEASGDEWLLREVAWPLLTGAFEGYAAMLEERPDGRLSLPVSVSPEWGEGAVGTWGRDASFQLAALHMLCDLLPKAARAAGEKHDIRWAEVAARTPRYTSVPVPPGTYDAPDAPTRYRIGLWEGQDLTESHRHHSHLAGIYPFASLRAEDDAVVRETLQSWAYTGAGQWSAWGMAWAVCLMARAGWRDGGRAWLRFLVDAAGNEGKSLSAGGSRGCFISWGSADVARLVAHEGDHEVMQLDANMGLVSALIELGR